MLFADFDELIFWFILFASRCKIADWDWGPLQICTQWLIHHTNCKQGNSIAIPIYLHKSEPWWFIGILRFMLLIEDFHSFAIKYCESWLSVFLFIQTVTGWIYRKFFLRWLTVASSKKVWSKYRIAGWHRDLCLTWKHIYYPWRHQMLTIMM